MTSSQGNPSAAAPKRIGELLVEAKILSDIDLKKGLDYALKSGMPLGRVLVMLRLITDIELRAALHVQALCKFEGMSSATAVRALAFAREKAVHIEWACKQVGWQSDKNSNVPPRLKQLKECLADCEQKLGADHPDVAAAQLQLAEFYEDEGMWPHAEACCQQAVESLEKLGENDLRLAAALWQLANLLFQQDRFEEALGLYKRVVDIRQTVLGSEHLQVASALFDIGEVLDVQRHYAEAERYYLQSLSVREKFQDIEEPEMIDTLKRLAHVCARLGRTPEQVLVGQLLTDSGMVAADRIPQALAFGQQNNVPLARALIMLDYLSEEGLRPVLHAQVLIKSNLLPACLASRILRLCHKQNLSIDQAMAKVGWKLQTHRTQNLAELLRTHDALIEAERAVPVDSQQIGALCLQLADLYETYERYADAEPLYKRALSIMERQDGNQEQLLVMLDKLAWLYVKQMKFEQAEALYKRVLDLRIEQYGATHADVANSYARLGDMYLQKGEHAQAVQLYEKALPVLEQESADNEVRIAEVLQQLGRAYLEGGDYDRAEPLLWHAFKIRKEHEDIRSYDMVSLLSKLADLYNKQGKYAKADSVLSMFQQEKSVYI